MELPIPELPPFPELVGVVGPVGVMIPGPVGVLPPLPPFVGGLSPGLVGVLPPLPPPFPPFVGVATGVGPTTLDPALNDKVSVPVHIAPLLVAPSTSNISMYILRTDASIVPESVTATEPPGWTVWPAT
jgi:hypothetical protein